VLGLTWNLLGAYQFIGSLSATPESLAATGFTPDQAQATLGQPAWMTAAYGFASGTGIGGCILLLMRRKAALPMLLLLLGCVVIFIGNLVTAVFAAMRQPYTSIMTFVVVFAAFLLWVSRHFGRVGQLR
jgi:hypothetical protein